MQQCKCITGNIGNGRFRLFFRYHGKARLIVYAWVNDSETLHTYGSRTDAYAVFRRMLDSGTRQTIGTRLCVPRRVPK